MAGFTSQRRPERLATKEKKRGIISPDVLSKSMAGLQQRFRKEFPDIARRAGRRMAERKRLFVRRRGYAWIRKRPGEGEAEAGNKRVGYPPGQQQGFHPTRRRTDHSRPNLHR